MARKSHNEKLNEVKDLPKIQHVSPDHKMARSWGSGKMLISAPREYDKVMRSVPDGKLTTSDRIRAHLAREHGADFTCPLTAGLFINIAAHASRERQEAGRDDITPYWRTLKKDGELNPKYPGGLEGHRRLLEAEGHQVMDRGRRSFVTDYESALHEDLRL